VIGFEKRAQVILLERARVKIGDRCFRQYRLRLETGATKQQGNGEDEWPILHVTIPHPKDLSLILYESHFPAASLIGQNDRKFILNLECRSISEMLHPVRRKLELRKSWN
jgi:hypothetical protein